MASRQDWPLKRRFVLLILARWGGFADEQISLLTSPPRSVGDVVQPTGGKKSRAAHGNTVAKRRPIESQIRAVIVRDHDEGKLPSEILASLKANRCLAEEARLAGIHLGARLIRRAIDAEEKRRKRADDSDKT